MHMIMFVTGIGQIWSCDCQISIIVSSKSILHILDPVDTSTAQTTSAKSSNLTEQNTGMKTLCITIEYVYNLT